MKVETVDSVKEDVQVCPMAVIKRREGQTFDDFRIQRSETNRSIRHFCKGILFHDTTEKGTYDVGSRKMKTERKETKRQKIKRMKNETK